ncbi:response regulator [Natrialbaceae archaeon A-gly3]
MTGTQAGDGGDDSPAGCPDRGERVDILLVEDNPGDVKLTKKAFEKASIEVRIEVASDGVEALDYLHERNDGSDALVPDLVLLDLNLPKKSGYEVLAEIKSDPGLQRIPVVILTSSESESDVIDTYDDHANAYLTKPVSFAGFQEVVEKIEGFWFCVSELPPR